MVMSLGLFDHGHFLYYHYDHSMISILEETNCYKHWNLRLNKYAALQCWGSKIQSKFHWMAMGNIIGPVFQASHIL